MDDATDRPEDHLGHPAVPTQAVRLAALSLLAYAVFHHLGTWVGALGDVGGAAAPGADPDRGVATTRWADWLDLLTPFALLVPAALALRAAGADRRSWWLLGTGVLLYVEGHGIHLAANSVGNVAPGRTAHLWDEVVGHHLWYLGWYLVVAALARTVGARPWPAVGRPAALALAVAVGATAGTNALEGGTVVLTGLAAAVAAAAGLRRRTTLAVWLVPAATVALLVLAGWGVWAGGFPQPSDVGVPPR